MGELSNLIDGGQTGPMPLESVTITSQATLIVLHFYILFQIRAQFCLIDLLVKNSVIKRKRQVFPTIAPHVHDEFYRKRQTNKQITVRSAKLSGRNLTALLMGGLDIMVPLCFLHFFFSYSCTDDFLK